MFPFHHPFFYIGAGVVALIVVIAIAAGGEETDGQGSQAGLRPSSQCSAFESAAEEARLAYARSAWKNISAADEQALVDVYESYCDAAAGARQPQSLGGIDELVDYGCEYEPSFSACLEELE